MGQGQGNIGVQLEERYFLQKVKLGQGSFGTVWRAVDRQSGNTVAIKQLDKASLPRRGVTRQDIEREISMMKACSHENITKLFDNFEDATSIYLALEYCDGGDFGDKVKERGMSAEEAEVAEWCRQMCAAIAALHSKGICHRDIKPDNFMVSGASMLKLSDFGLAIFLPRGKLLQEKCGTPAFMAPEQHHLPKRSPGYSFPVDIWATGVSMFMMMFGGKHPFLNERGHLDDGLLLSGELDFRDNAGYNGFFGFGARPLRFSEEARRLCKSMVEPDAARRVTAEEAMSSPWLLMGMDRDRGHQGEPSREERSPSAPRSREEPPPRSLTPRRGQQQQLEPVPSAPPPERPSRPRSPATREPDQRALREAAKLKEQNETLQAELDERRRREEQLLQEQKQLQMQKKMLQQQRTKELQLQNEKLIEQEKQLQRVEQEKAELEQQRAKESEQLERGGKPRATTTQGTSSSRKSTSTSGPAVNGQLRRGLRCRYESGTYGWMTAVVQGYNDSDGTYNLDVRQHASLDKIAPTSEVTAPEAWPPGTLVAYHSASVSQWLPAVVISFNETDGTYNLDVRDHADLDRIRARVGDRPTGDTEEPVGRRGSASSGPYLTEMSDSKTAPRRHQTQDSKSAQSRESTKAPIRVGDLESTGMATGNVATGSGGRKVGVGDRVMLVEHGLAMVEAVQDGTYAVRTGDRQRLKVQADQLRAPSEAKVAWPAGTKVAYQSASLKGKWIDANVVSFNSGTGTYNLDVRMEAAADKVRPR